MLIRFVFLAIVAMMFAGCSGWASEKPLLPPAERDSVPLSGTYLSETGQLRITPEKDALYLVQYADRDAEAGDADEEPVEAAFDLLRSRKPQPGNEAAEPERDYLLQIRWDDDRGNIRYLYTIVTITEAFDEQSSSFRYFDMLCAGATRAFAIREEDGFCVFDDYRKLRAAAFDALAWQDDARMGLSETRYYLPEPAEPLQER